MVTLEADGLGAVGREVLVKLAFEPAVEPADVQVCANEGIAEHLVPDALGGVCVADVADGGARRGVDLQPSTLAEERDTEEMRAIGDDDQRVKVLSLGDASEQVYLLLGVDGAGLGDDVVEGDAIGEEIVATDASLGFAGVLVRSAAERDDDGSDASVVEGDGLVETGMKDRGRAASVLCCSEDGDSVGGLGVIDGGGVLDLAIEPGEPSCGDEDAEESEPAQKAQAEVASRGRVGWAA